MFQPVSFIEEVLFHDLVFEVWVFMDKRVPNSVTCETLFVAISDRKRHCGPDGPSIVSK